jgi:hypothetical protein
LRLEAIRRRLGCNEDLSFPTNFPKTVSKKHTRWLSLKGGTSNALFTFTNFHTDQPCTSVKKKALGQSVWGAGGLVGLMFQVSEAVLNFMSGRQPAPESRLQDRKGRPQGTPPPKPPRLEVIPESEGTPSQCWAKVRSHSGLW